MSALIALALSASIALNVVLIAKIGEQVENEQD